MICLPLLTAASAPSQQTASPSADYTRTIQPLLAKHCVSCHGGGSGKPKADFDLRKYPTEASLRQNAKIWRQVIRVLNSHEMPPSESKAPIAQADRESLAKAVDVVLSWVDPKAPLNPGRVTLRRLNRVEYGNTVKDLTGIDFDPAEDFPSDDIGHGFDNIGDVLTLPPVLMERYLSAAESIVARVFPAQPMKPQDKHTGAKYLEPAGRGVPQSNFRPVKAGQKDPIHGGPLHLQFKLDPDGEYAFRFKAYAKEKPAKVAVLLCGKNVPNPAPDADVAKLSGGAVNGLRPFRILTTLDVDVAPEERKSKRHELKIPPTPGVERIALALVKDTAPEIHVESFVLTGPLDPRPKFQRATLDAVAGKPRPDATRSILRDFASKAFRRPATENEVGRYAAMVEAAEKDGQRWEAGLGLALQAILCSPKFLFRVELDSRADGAGVVPLDDWQLASRLSYFLWSTGPDDELRALAAKGQLAANLEAQARRMLKDPRATASLVDNFAMQWLQLRRLSFVAPDGALFPQFNQRLRASMIRETELFLEAVVREDRSVLDLVGADYTYLNERLARHYGIADTAGNLREQKDKKPGGKPFPRDDEFVRVPLQDGRRGGLLGHASILTVTSNPTRTSPVKRGRWVLEQILGEPPPPPPPDVPELEEQDPKQQTGSLKRRMEQHRADPRCSNCHARMDAIGFALENYDAVGGWRAKDGGFDVDPSGAFPDGTAFKGPEDLRKVLLSRKDLFVRCLAEKMLTYALGRGVEPYDDPALRKIVDATAKDGHKISRLVVEIVKSDPFRLRRGRNSQD